MVKYDLQKKRSIQMIKDKFKKKVQLKVDIPVIMNILVQLFYS